MQSRCIALTTIPVYRFKINACSPTETDLLYAGAGLTEENEINTSNRSGKITDAGARKRFDVTTRRP